MPESADGPPERVRGRRAVAEFDEERVLADVGGDAFELEGLEARPAEEARVRGDEFAEAFNERFVIHARAGLLRGRDL